MTPVSFRSMARANSCPGKTLGIALLTGGPAIVLVLAIMPVNHAAASDDVPTGQAAVMRLDGTIVTGPLTAFETDSVQLGATADGQDAKSIPADDVLSITFPRRSTGAMPPDVLEFANGDRLAVEINASQGDSIIASTGEMMLTVPLEVLRGIRRQPSTSEGEAAVLYRESGGNDLIILTNGDRFAGQFLGFSATELSLDVEGREVRIPRDRIATVAFSPELISTRSLDGERQIVQSTEGWLTVSGLERTADGAFQGETAFGETVHWSMGEIRRIQFAGSQAVFLSDLEPSQVEFVPYFDRIWPVRFDRDVTGEPLTVGGTISAKGLGVHSRCHVTYDLNGDYRMFHATAGLAKSAGSLGNVEFAVEIDGREVVRSGPMSQADPPLKIEALDVTDARELVLTVDFGRNGDVRDRANWCDAILVK